MKKIVASLAMAVGLVVIALLGAPHAGAYAYWQAIAYSPSTGLYVWVADEPSGLKAEIDAVALLGMTDGQLAAKSTGYVALAVDPHNGDWYGGIGPTPAAADISALNHLPGGSIVLTVGP